MLNPSWTEWVTLFLIGSVTGWVMWRGLLNVARDANRGSARQPGTAIIFMVLAMTVLVAPGYIAWKAPPPIWTWPIWFASAWGFFLLALEACWIDGIFPWIEFPAPDRKE